MIYFTTLTNTALVKISTALANNAKITMSEMAIGDGNGSPTSPAPNNTQLVREVYRTAVNQLGLNQSGRLVAEMIVPADVGGFTVREIALYDSDGDLFAIGMMPAIDKPEISENAVGELVLRMIIAIDHASTINLTIDTALVTATQQWVEFNFNPGALFPGGTTNQVLAKKSNLDGDTEWRDPTSVNVVVDTIEESQTLAADQTIVTLTTVTTTGLAVYIEGIRLPRSAWTPNTATQITLARSYPAGSNITMVQNEPAANLEPIKVGQIIMLGLTTTPDQLFGYGTWARVAEGRAIFGYTAADSDFNALAKTGGSKTHSHTGATNTAGAHSHAGSTGGGGDHNHGASTASAGEHSHTTQTAGSHSHGSSTSSSGNHGHTVLASGAHTHTVPTIGWGASQVSGSLAEPTTSGRLITGSGRVEDNENLESLAQATINVESSSSGTHSHGIELNGEHAHGISADGSHAHNVNAAGSHAHSIQNSGTHTHSITSDGTHSHTVLTDGAGNLPPYFTVAMWQRTA
jgi:hypothetical protein